MFIDESGDHGLANIDKQYPVFVLCGVIIERGAYEELKNQFNTLKERYWGGKKVIFHSRDIRKCDKEFSILLNIGLKNEFYSQLNNIIQSIPYTIVSSVVHKEEYIKKYGKIGQDIYGISLSFLLERGVFYLDKNCKDTKETYVVIERRGQKEDDNLSSHFQKVTSRGTFFVTPNRFTSYGFRCHFRHKKEDVVGLQLADLIAYPIATHCIDPERANPAFELIEPKFYKGEGKNYGLKKYP